MHGQSVAEWLIRSRVGQDDVFPADYTAFYDDRLCTASSTLCHALWDMACGWCLVSCLWCVMMNLYIGDATAVCVGMRDESVDCRIMKDSAFFLRCLARFEHYSAFSSVHS